MTVVRLALNVVLVARMVPQLDLIDSGGFIATIDSAPPNQEASNDQTKRKQPNEPPQGGKLEDKCITCCANLVGPLVSR
jgi:hypothetical protein